MRKGTLENKQHQIDTIIGLKSNYADGQIVCKVSWLPLKVELPQKWDSSLPSFDNSFKSETSAS
jgi:hypothetical protein